MSATHLQESDLPSSEHTGSAQEHAGADPALDRAIERMLEAEMAKGLITSFTEDFNSLMQHLETGIRAEHAAMDKLRRRLRAR